MTRFKQAWILLLGLPLMGCAGPEPFLDNDNLLSDNDNILENTNDHPDSENLNDNLDSNNNDNVFNENDNVVIEPSLIVSLGENRNIYADELISLEAAVQEAPAGADIYYLWEIYDESQPAAVVSQTKDYVLGLSRIELVLTELYPDSSLAGRVFGVRADVLAVMDQVMASGLGEITLRVIADSSNDPNGNDNSTPDDNSNDNQNDNLNENTNQNDNTSTNDNIGGGSGGGGGGGIPCTGTCCGTNGLAVFLPDSISMNLSDGLSYVEVTICNGTGPFTYTWSPTTYLGYSDEPVGGAPISLNSPDVDFMPTTTGSFSLNVSVQDSLGAVSNDTVTITVN